LAGGGCMMDALPCVLLAGVQLATDAEQSACAFEGISLGHLDVVGKRPEPSCCPSPRVTLRPPMPVLMSPAAVSFTSTRIWSPMISLLVNSNDQSMGRMPRAACPRSAGPARSRAACRRDPPVLDGVSLPEWTLQNLDDFTLHFPAPWLVVL